MPKHLPIPLLLFFAAVTRPVPLLLTLCFLLLSRQDASSQIDDARLSLWGIPRVETYYSRDTGVRGTIHHLGSLPNGELAILTSVGCFTFDGTNWERVGDLAWANHSLILPQQKQTIISQRDGLARLDADAFGGYQVESLTPADKYPTNLPSLEIAAFARGHFFGLAGIHLVIVDPDGNIDYHRLSNWATSCFAIEDELYLTGGNDNLLARWDWETNTLTDATSLLDSCNVYEWMTAVAPRIEGGVWLLTQTNKLISFDGSKTALWPGSTALAEDPTRVTSFAQTAPGTLAIGTSSKGLLIIDNQGETLLHYSKQQGLDDVHIQKVGVDSQGGVWIATENSLTRVPSDSQSLFFDESHGLVEDITSIALLHDRIYLGTEYGLYVSNPDATQMSEAFTLLRQQNDIEDMIVVQDTLFISGGITLVMDADQQFREIDPVGPTNFFQPPKHPGVVLAGNFRGIHRYERRDGAWTFIARLEGPEQDVYSLAEDEHGNLFGSLGGSEIARIFLDEEGGHTETIPLPNPTKGIWSTIVNIEGQLYVNTSPCVRWDNSSQTFVTDNEMHYYPGGPPYGFEQVFGRNGEDAFVALNARSSIVLPRPDKSVIGDISSIGYSIDTRATCIAQAANGNIWAGGIFGLIRAKAKPRSATAAEIRPRLHRIRLANTRQPLPIKASADAPLILQHSENSLQLSIEFPSFSAASHHQYQIYIDGLDSAWDDFSDDHERELSNLSPGHYTIRINAMDATGEMYSSHDYEFIILTPWYLKPWAYALYLTAAAIVVFAIVRYYNRVQIQKSRKLAQLVRERTNEVEAKNMELQLQAGRLESQNNELEEKTEELTATTETLTATLNQLQEMQNQLVDTARTAGKAEVAINVLHNVGNVLNSLNVSVNVLSQKTQGSHASKLGRIANLVCQHQSDLAEFISSDPRGKNVPNYLLQLSKTLEDEMAATLYELGVMNDDIDHIKSVIAAQQTHAKNDCVIEDVCIRELCETALSIIGKDHGRHQIEIINEIPDALIVKNDKHRLLDVILNLISNAFDAIYEQGPEIGIIALSSAQHVSTDQISIYVSDNGIGIATEIYEKLFRHGFTTKTKGHGFGLHSCANAAKVLGGELTLKSPGTGLGATATLTLPTEHTPRPASSTR
ncbi:ATP-binding protein [Pelagicoccus sp. SDUM812002]|uniref:sensor histidine kinase n=1 Tax=Pelagicoccus sp. SDUM812002 TaxID=3041266 RepID=UPI00280CD830|nr:ATP-binding protein [Pelagicoccus sp. SDUM812002]MDQ8187111.1 ATP-binding protein [Pelagicoccus sp. SDUM812002]